MKFMVIIFAIIVAISAERCVDYGWDYFAHGLYDIDRLTNVEHWSDCANHCKIHKSCKYWTWNIGTKSDRYHCILKSSMKNRVQSGDAISGKYDCTSET